MQTTSMRRRDWLRNVSFGVAAGSASGWMHALAADAADNRLRKKSVIMLWLNGGPATIDMWDVKTGHANGGPTKEIATAAPGLRISEHLPRLATQARDLVVVRSMNSKEGDHGRATFYVRTGYTPVGAIQFPAVGAVLAHELGDPSADLPGFVSITPSRNASEINGGFLGPRFAPLVIGEPVGRGAASVAGLKVPNLEAIPGVSAAAQSGRVGLREAMEKQFTDGRNSAVLDAMQAATNSALRLMRPEAAAAFELEREKESVRNAYGRSLFGQGCLLARRLVERGVPCVEVTLDGWDTHNNNFERVAGLCGTLDRAFAALLADLRDRGMLHGTLVVCMGEFGRTPKINGNNGRDHWPATWSAVLAGGGIHGGQAVGKTSADGTQVEERPTGVPDLVATVCSAVGLDPRKQNMSNVGRPIRLADPVARVIEGVL